MICMFHAKGTTVSKYWIPVSDMHMRADEYTCELLMYTLKGTEICNFEMHQTTGWMTDVWKDTQ